MSFTRARDLVSAAVIAGLLVHLLLQLAYGEIPPLPRFAGVPLLAFAIAEVILGASLRARIRQRPGTLPVTPFTAVKAVVLAKASSLAGALTAGAWLGVLVYVLPRRVALTPAAADTTTALIGVFCAAALVAAALWLEYCCRTPDGPDAPPDGPQVHRADRGESHGAEWEDGRVEGRRDGPA